MNCKVEKTENANEVKLEITVDAEKFENAMKKVYFQNAKYINIPGFRKGKAPMNIVEKYYIKHQSNIAISTSTRDCYTRCYGGEQPPIIYNGIDEIPQKKFQVIK